MSVVRGRLLTSSRRRLSASALRLALKRSISIRPQTAKAEQYRRAGGPAGPSSRQVPGVVASARFERHCRTLPKPPSSRARATPRSTHTHNRSQDRADGRDAEPALPAGSKSRPMANTQERPRALETQLQAVDHSGATSMKSGASSVTQCDLQVTSIIGILNAHCGVGSSRRRARLRVVIHRQPPIDPRSRPPTTA